MKKDKSTKKINPPCKSEITPAFSQPESGEKWLQAADRARLKIADHRKKIRQLEEAMRTFEQYAKEGQRWPERVSS